MIDCTDAIFVENKTELSWLIRHVIVCDKNQTRQWHDRSFRYGLHKKWNWVIMFDWTGYSLLQKLDKTTMLPFYRFGLYWNQNWTIGTYLIECGWSMMKTIQATTWLIVQLQSMPKMKLSCYDRSNWVPFMTKTRQDNDLIDHTCMVYNENDTKLS